MVSSTEVQNRFGKYLQLAVQEEIITLVMAFQWQNSAVWRNRQLQQAFFWDSN